eukprot:498257-Prorocentrum_minimum.AAC.1
MLPTHAHRSAVLSVTSELSVFRLRESYLLPVNSEPDIHRQERNTTAVRCSQSPPSRISADGRGLQRFANAGAESSRHGEASL